jgi:hypothetical protein
VRLGLYETSAKLLELGFMEAHDITLEAALCKLQVLLGDPDLSTEEVEEAFQRNMAGEQSTSLFRSLYSSHGGSIGPQGRAPAQVRIPGRPLEGKWDATHLECALLRFSGAKLSNAADDFAYFRIFANLDATEQTSENHPGYAGKHRREVHQEPGSMVFDVTHAVQAMGQPGERLSFTLLLNTPGATFSWQEVDLALVVREGAE